MPSTNGLLGQMDKNGDDSGAVRPDGEPLLNGDMVEQSLVDGVTDTSQSVIETPEKEEQSRRTETENEASTDDRDMEHKVGVNEIFLKWTSRFVMFLL